jgi:hypothetical protein
VEELITITFWKCRAGDGLSDENDTHSYLWRGDGDDVSPWLWMLV